MLRISPPKSVKSVRVNSVAVAPPLNLISCTNIVSSTKVVDAFAPLKCDSNSVYESFVNSPLGTANVVV